MSGVRGEHIGSFYSPAVLQAGVTLEAFRYDPGTLAMTEQELAAYGASPPLHGPMASELAVALGATYGDGVQHEQLAKQIADSAGTYYAVRMVGARHRDGIVATGYTEDAARSDSPLFLVNALEVRRDDVGTRLGRYEASVALFCMVRHLGDDALILFRRREAGKETRDGYFATIGVEPRQAAPLGFNELLGYAAAGTVLTKLSETYGLTRESGDLPENP